MLLTQMALFGSHRNHVEAAATCLVARQGSHGFQIWGYPEVSKEEGWVYAETNSL
jgi:hypothetical protein